MNNINPLGHINYQRSIDVEIDKKKIYNIYLSNIDHFRDHCQNSNDIYAKDLLNQLKDNKKFEFPITKQMELFILKNQNDVQKIIKYVSYRSSR